MAGITIGSVAVAVVPSLQGFTDELRAQLIPEADALGVDLGEHIAAGINSALHDVGLDVHANTRAADAALAQTKAAAEDLGKPPPVITPKVDPAAAEAGLGEVKAAADAVAADSPVITPQVRDAPVAGMLALLNAIRADADKPIKVTFDTTSAKAAAFAIDTASAAAGRASGAFRLLRTRFDLFGGALGKFALPAVLATVTGLHLVIDAAIETAAVLIPAAIGFIAFSAAAVPAVQHIVTEFQNLHAVSEATGQQIPGLTGGFAKVAAAVRPQVYTLMGEALDAINKKSNTFMTLATGVGKALDQIGARASVAFGGGGMTTFIASAVHDVTQISDIVGNLFGTVGNVLRVVPGYAQTLLGILDGVTKGLEHVTGSAIGQGVLKLGLAFHGAAVYMGVAALAAGKLVTGGLSGVSRLADAAGEGLAKMGLGGGRAASAMSALTDSAGAAAGLPWGWIAAAAAGIAFLAIKLITAKDATQQWLSSLQGTLNAAPAVRGFTLLQSDQAAVATRLAIAQHALVAPTAALAAANKDVGSGVAFAWGAQRKANDAYRAAKRPVDDLTAGQKVLADQSTLYGERVAKLGVVLGGTAQAQGLLTASGVTWAQLMDKSSEGWAKLIAQVEGTLKAYQLMGQFGGRFGADMNAMNIATSSQVAAMTKLNQAFDAVIGIVSGGQNSFITFEQDLRGVGTAGRAAGASMTGLSKNSLALRSAWQKAFADASTMTDSLRMMASISPGGFPPVTRAVRDTIAQLIPFGKQSKATRAELIGMAQEINPNVTSWKQLVKWVGNIKHPGEDANRLLAKMGVNIQDLGADAKTMSGDMNTYLIHSFNMAKFAANGTNTSITTLGKDMGATHPNAVRIAADAKTLYDKLVNVDGMSKSAARALVDTLDPAFQKTGSGAKSASGFVDGLQSSIGKLHSKTITITEKGLGTFSIAQAGGKFGRLSGTSAHAVLGGTAAHGAYITAGSGPTADDVLARVSRGELVVPAKMVSAGLVDHLRGLIPGFAAGGLAGLGGQTTAFGQHFEARMTAAMEKAMTAAMKKAIAAARAAAATSGALGGGAAENMALARKLMPGWASGSQWAAWQALWTRESGWSRTARNPSSGAYGIPQALPPTKMPFAAQAAGGSHAGPQIDWGAGYIRSRYGSPVAAEAHERSAGWYDDGGWMPPGLSLSLNGTGRPEPVISAAQWDTLTAAAGSDGAEALGGRAMARRLDRMITLLERAPVRTASGLSDALDAAGGRAVHRAWHRSS